MDDKKLDEMYTMVKEIFNHLHKGPQAKRSDAEKYTHQLQEQLDEVVDDVFDNG